MWKRVFSLVCLLSFCSLATAQTDEKVYQAGKDYIVLPTPVKTADPAKVEVVELFGYACPHCYSFEPVLEAWVAKQNDQVMFSRIPVVFGRSWEPLARAYYTAEFMNALEATHEPVFDAIHKERKRFRDLDDLTEFYTELGVDGEKFKKTFDSFAVKMKLNQGDAKVRSYQVDGVPAIVVNGKYRISGNTAGSNQAMLDVADYLIKQEQAVSGKSAAEK